MRDIVRVLVISTLLIMPTAKSQGPLENLDQIRGTAFDGSELVEDSCEVLAKNEGEDPGLRYVPGMFVLGRSEDDPLVLMSTDDVEIKGVVCWRSAAKFSATDYLVPERLGVPFYVKTGEGDEETNRTIVLEKINANYRVRLLSGPAFTDEDKETFIDLLRYFDKLESSAGA